MARQRAALFQDETTDYLQRFVDDQSVIEKIIFAVSMRFKAIAKNENAKNFTRRTGRYQRSIHFVQRSKASSSRLFAGNLSAIYDREGALIGPDKHKALRFVAPDGSVVFCRGIVYVRPRPWFLRAMKEAKLEHQGDEVALAALDRILSDKYKELLRNV